MSINLSVEALQAAVKVAVDEGLIAKHAATHTYMETWGTVNRVILAALNQNKLDGNHNE